MFGLFRSKNLICSFLIAVKMQKSGHCTKIHKWARLFQLLNSCYFEFLFWIVHSEYSIPAGAFKRPLVLRTTYLPDVLYKNNQISPKQLNLTSSFCHSCQKLLWIWTRWFGVKFELIKYYNSCLKKMTLASYVVKSDMKAIIFLLV